jgi:hypothetical protein
MKVAKLGLNARFAERPVLGCPRSRSAAAVVAPAKPACKSDSDDDLAAITAATLVVELSDGSADPRQQRYRQLSGDAAVDVNSVLSPRCLVVSVDLGNDLWGGFD